MSLHLALAALAMILSPLQDPDRPTAATAQGQVRGVTGDGVAAFKGLPYAAPPVGDLRWAPPRSPAEWTGVRDALDDGALCIQPPANGDPGVGPLPMSEDCLTLNVWTPAARAVPLPVMVWIHGGGYNNGSGTAALYDGSALARRGVVVVTINYRLGRLGFFDHPALAADRAAGQAAGNYGVMDVIAALKWVKANIAVFGEVVGVHLRDDCLIDGLFDVTRFGLLARLGYRDYAVIRETLSLTRPGE
jgi:para-nitrobenzyl esterase